MDNSNSAVEKSNVEAPNKADDRVEGQKVDAADPGYGFLLDDQMKEELAKASQNIIPPESHIPNLLGSPEKKDSEQESKVVSSAPEFEEPSGPEKVGESTEAEQRNGSPHEEKAGEGVATEEKAEMNGEKPEEYETNKRQELGDDNTVDMEQLRQGGSDDSFADVSKQEGKPEDARESRPKETGDFNLEKEEEPTFEETNEAEPETKEEPEMKKEPETKEQREMKKEPETKEQPEMKKEPETRPEPEPAEPRNESKTVEPAEKEEEKASAPPIEEVIEEAKPYDFLQAYPSGAPVETGPPILSQVMEALKSEDKSLFQSPAASRSPTSADVKTSTAAAGTGTQHRHFFDLGEWLERNRLHPQVADLLYWRDPRKSGAALGTILVVLLSLKFLSLISVVSYAALAALAITLSFRIYKNVMQAVQKTQDGHPFKEYLEMDVTVPSDKVHKTADVLAARLNSIVLELRRLFLVEDLFDSLKFGLALWLLTYVGAWFNGLTLVIFAVVGLFTLPKVYETHQDKIDQNLDMARGKINEITEKVQAVLPIGKKPKSQ